MCCKGYTVTFACLCVSLTLLAISVAFLATWYPGVKWAGKLPFPLCCS